MPSDAEACRCRVCAWRNVVPPWGADGRSPTYDFCPCCGVEFGYQDFSAVGARRFREDWIARGAAWATPAARPASWSLDLQLRQVPEEFR
jgi:hypothetical protein